MRCAICFTPAPDDPLTVAAARWIGRDAFTGERIEDVETAGLTESDRAYLTAAVRRYGFHGILKAPFSITATHHLKHLDSALGRFALHQQTVTVPDLKIRLVSDGYALAPSAVSPELASLAAAVVSGFVSFHAPLDETDFARRSHAKLSGRQLGYLAQWGDPYVFEDFRFFMSLTGPVPSAERDHVRAVLERYFGELATSAIVIDRLALFIEPEPYAPFRVHSVHKLAARIALRSA